MKDIVSRTGAPMKGRCTVEGCIEPTPPDKDGMAHVYCPLHNEEYVATCAGQLEAWVDARSVHNHRFNECCPDFSCCRPELLASEDVRRAFQQAGPETREAMLWDFLAALYPAAK